MAKPAHNETQIFDRIKTIIPPVDELAAAIQVEHNTAARLRKLMLIVHASAVEMGEAISQLTLSTGDIANAQADLNSIQRVNMDAMEQLADRNAGARTVIQNLDVWLKSDPASIAHVLQIAELSQLTEAARSLDRERIFSVMNAIAGALEGKE